MRRKRERVPCSENGINDPRARAYVKREESENDFCGLALYRGSLTRAGGAKRAIYIYTYSFYGDSERRVYIYRAA